MANIVDMDEDMEEKEEAVAITTPATSTMEKEVGIHKKQEVAEEEPHGRGEINHKSNVSTATRLVITQPSVDSRRRWKRKLIL